MALDPVVSDIVVEALAVIQSQPVASRRPGWPAPDSDVG
jgi:hypothetical protein